MDVNDRSEYARLATRLDELTRVCAQLSRQNADLHHQVARLSAGATGPSRRGRRETRDGLSGMVSRRMIGKALGAVAVGTVGAVALVNEGTGPAEAADGDAIKAGQSTTCESETELKFDGSMSPHMIFLVNDTSISGASTAHPASLGGWAGGNVANGIYGFTEVEAGDGVVGQVGFGNMTGNGVHGLAGGFSTVAVLGENSAGTAIAGTCDSFSADATAIVGTMTSTSPGRLSAAVRGVNNGTGNDGIGVWGSQAGGGWGVYGTVHSGIGVNADGGTGIGLQGRGNTGAKATGSGAGGRGGVFSGSAAQVQLSPGSKATHPTNGKRGDLYADRNGRLWFCKKGGTIATWHQVA